MPRQEGHSMVHLTTALDPASAVPLYEQLYRSLAAEMRAGTLTAGTRMPGKRRLAAELSVSVNTVDTAYQMLAAEGLPDRPGAQRLHGAGVSCPAAGGCSRPPRPLRRWQRTPPTPPRRCSSIYLPGAWTRGCSPSAHGHGCKRNCSIPRRSCSPRGCPGRRCSAAGAGRVSGRVPGRAVRPGAAGGGCRSGISAGAAGTAAARPCCRGDSRLPPRPAGAGKQRRALPLPAGGRGRPVADGSFRQRCGGVLRHPSHQFPTGVTMPAGRRAELLHWAARAPGRRYIIEDDYDSEFRFDTRPLPSLQGMAGADGPVVYLSTCSRSLAPGIRIAYMVLPRQLLGAWQAKYRLYSGTVGRFEQQTLARFITGGYFTRHLARERTAYKARRDALVAALRTSFAPEELTLAGLHTGLHLLAQLKDPPPDAALRAAARQYGVRCSLLSDYDLTGTAHSAAGTLVLGYGSLPDADCAAAGERLKKLCTAAREASDTV